MDCQFRMFSFSRHFFRLRCCASPEYQVQPFCLLLTHENYENWTDISSLGALIERADTQSRDCWPLKTEILTKWSGWLDTPRNRPEADYESFLRLLATPNWGEIFQKLIKSICLYYGYESTVSREKNLGFGIACSAGKSKQSRRHSCFRLLSGEFHLTPQLTLNSCRRCKRVSPARGRKIESEPYRKAFSQSTAILPPTCWNIRLIGWLYVSRTGQAVWSRDALICIKTRKTLVGLSTGIRRKRIPQTMKIDKSAEWRTFVRVHSTRRSSQYRTRLMTHHLMVSVLQVISGFSGAARRVFTGGHLKKNLRITWRL